MTMSGIQSDLKQRICTFLKGKKEGCTVRQIVKAVGHTGKEVNSVLYTLLEEEGLYKIQDQPPIWSIEKPGADITSVKSPKLLRRLEISPDKTREDVRRVLASKSDRRGMKALDIARELGQTRRLVTKQLYDLKSRGQVIKLGENQWLSVETTRDSEANFRGQLIKFRSDDQDISISLRENSRFSKDFDLITVLGAGGFGCVTKAGHREDDKTYAVKIVKCTGEATREVRALAALEHPNIVRYYTSWREEAHWVDRFDCSSLNSSILSEDSKYNSDEADGSICGTNQSDGSICETNQSDDSDSDLSDTDEEQDQANCSATDSSSINGDCLFIQMEFCEGGALTHWIQKNTNRTKEMALRLFHQLVDGVNYIHSKRLIHRDLKPDNILFGRNDIVKIGDFGLVATISTLNEASMYRTVARGTPLYMSPEQETKKKYDEKTDIFSLAVIFFELLWCMSTAMERCKVLLDVRNHTCPIGFREEYSSEWKLINKMLSENPASRPDTQQVLNALRLLKKSKTELQPRTA
ncbi:hypothetical protein UPYG_G00131080 [Umbra pygmaea]|uniref:non-specific serine/threonine protein kinase n=1 Tax=Umbra pygmaea TaxID=75934 RepID=A0ABD0XI84_UMBPY